MLFLQIKILPNNFFKSLSLSKILLDPRLSFVNDSEQMVGRAAAVFRILYQAFNHTFPKNLPPDYLRSPVRVK